VITARPTATTAARLHDTPTFRMVIAAILWRRQNRLIHKGGRTSVDLRS
jgi:hypothetical protein